jgi:hypothetical protein
MSVNLLDAILTLSNDNGKRTLSRVHLYGAVLRVALHLTDVLRIGDAVTVNQRIYCLQKTEKQEGGAAYIITVDNGRGPAILGDRVHVKPFIPHASYEEHVLFAEHAEKIITAFGDLIKTEVVRSGAAANEAISEAQYVDRII